MKHPFYSLSIAFLSTLLLLLPNAAQAADSDETITEAQVIALVKKTVADITKDAPGTLDKINAAEAPYQDASNPALYTMVYDTDVIICGHPKSDLQGKSMKGKPDVQGKKFRDEIVAQALEKQTAWVDYAYQKPNSTGIFQKTTYCVAVKGSDGKMYIVCSGMYKPKS